MVADVEYIRRFCFLQLGAERICFRAFYKVDSTATARWLDWEMDLSCPLVLSDSKNKLKIAESVVVESRPITATTVERAFIGQEFYDVRIVQKLVLGCGSPSVSVCILQQCRWSDCSATRDEALKSWLGALQTLTRILVALVHLRCAF